MCKSFWAGLLALHRGMAGQRALPTALSAVFELKWASNVYDEFPLRFHL